MFRRPLALLALASTLIAACELVPSVPDDRSGSVPADRSNASFGAGGTGDALAGTAVGADRRAPLRVLTWNLEWFMEPEHGPADEDRQLNGARDALQAIGADLLALQEVSSPQALAALLATMPGYQGVLSSYDYPQRLALVFHAPLSLRGVSEIAGLDAAGRPPLEVALRDERDGSELLVVVVHAKAFADASSWERRARFADGLHAYLARERADQRLIIAGDFNDGLLRSTVAGHDSPYAVFTADPAYVEPTLELERAGDGGSTAQGGALLDHIVLSAALAASAVAGSADVLREEMLARNPSFSATISDHFPVVLRMQ
jgi:endonuclease/exonuclease/phosphatase family metal-dependent hydrolase